MKNFISLCAVAGLSLMGCGDNIKVHNDAPPTIDGSGGFPAAPTLGPQIDREGRPTINTALNHPFDPTPAAGSAKDAYNHDEAVGMWPQTWAPEFAPNLAILDALDTGICGNGICEADAGETAVTCLAGSGSDGLVGSGDCPLLGGGINGSDGCGNQAFNDPTLGKFAYLPLATVLADDQLYLETSKGNCAGYLAVEFYTQVLGFPVSSSCGGRAPSYDVIDTTYTLAAIGVKGFDPTTFAPAFGDKVDKHNDTSDTTFPFLGAPHTM